MKIVDLIWISIQAWLIFMFVRPFFRALNGKDTSSLSDGHVFITLIQIGIAVFILLNLAEGIDDLRKFGYILH